MLLRCADGRFLPHLTAEALAVKGGQMVQDFVLGACGQPSAIQSRAMQHLARVCVETAVAHAGPSGRDGCRAPAMALPVVSACMDWVLHPVVPDGEVPVLPVVRLSLLTALVTLLRAHDHLHDDLGRAVPMVRRVLGAVLARAAPAGLPTLQLLMPGLHYLHQIGLSSARLLVGAQGEHGSQVLALAVATLQLHGGAATEDDPATSLLPAVLAEAAMLVQAVALVCPRAREDVVGVVPVLVAATRAWPGATDLLGSVSACLRCLLDSPATVGVALGAGILDLGVRMVEGRPEDSRAVGSYLLMLKMVSATLPQDAHVLSRDHEARVWRLVASNLEDALLVKSGLLFLQNLRHVWIAAGLSPVDVAARLEVLTAAAAEHPRNADVVGLVLLLAMAVVDAWCPEDGGDVGARATACAAVNSVGEGLAAYRGPMPSPTISIAGAWMIWRQRQDGSLPLVCPKLLAFFTAAQKEYPEQVAHVVQQVVECTGLYGSLELLLDLSVWPARSAE
jgi:hypothetical protein